MNGTQWSVDYGTCVLGASCALAWVAVLLIRWYDVYQAKRSEYVKSWQEERER